jgi:uncharacterized protein (DUF1499 family)
MTNLDSAMTAREPRRTSATSLWLGIIGVIMAVLGAVGSGQGFWPFTIGLLMVVIAFLFAVIGGLSGVFAAIRKPSASPLGQRIAIGLTLCSAVLVAIGPWIYRGAHFPPIHDVTTDLANPPAFATLPLRKDNLAGVDNVDKWRALHKAAYGDLAPIKINMAPAAVITRAAKLASERGWEIAPSTLPATADQLEATATESPFKFKDDIIIVATAVPGTTSSLVNMRSVSRVGASDFGVNAKRIREFLAALQTSR